VTVNPIVAGLFGAVALGEPVTMNLVIGLILVAAGIIFATSDRQRASRRPAAP
jgi:drug/metabolite transporter (DMT)-like permease